MSLEHVVETGTDLIYASQRVNFSHPAAVAIVVNHRRGLAVVDIHPMPDRIRFVICPTFNIASLFKPFDQFVDVNSEENYGVERDSYPI